MVRMGLPVRFRRGLHTQADQPKRSLARRLGPVGKAMLVVLAFGMVLDRRLPNGEHFPG
jgi:hypothetical protein